jgi:hypothetical protein
MTSSSSTIEFPSKFESELVLLFPFVEERRFLRGVLRDTGRAVTGDRALKIEANAVVIGEEEEKEARGVEVSEEMDEKEVEDVDEEQSGRGEGRVEALS